MPEVGNSEYERFRALTDPAAEAWEAPEPFDEPPPAPEFPVEVLPGEMAAFVEALSEATQTPPEMGGVLALGVLATVFQGKYRVRLNSGWTETLSLYCVAVAPPAERKSAVIGALTRPIQEYETARREAETVAVVQSQQKKDLLLRRLEAAKVAASKGKGDEEEVLALAEELACFQEQVPFRLLCDDVTPEKLVDLMAAQGGSMTVLSSEGGVFDTLCGRYENKNGLALEVYLKGHDGDLLRVERISRKLNDVKDPHLTLILTVQPEVLRGVMQNQTFKGRGLCGRILYAVCRSKVGHREIDPPPVPEGVREAYRAYLFRLLDSPGSGVLTLDADATRLFHDFQEGVEALLGDEWEHMRDWAGKLCGAAARLAGLFHAATATGDPAAEQISGATMAAAIRLAWCLAGHAENAYQQMGADEAQERAIWLLRRILQTRRETLTKRELLRLCRRFSAAEMEEPLAELERRGYLRQVTTGERGRKAQKILVNPLVLRG